MYGDTIYDAIEPTLRTFDRVIVVLSRSYIEDNWLNEKELATYISKEKAGKLAPIVPVLIGDITDDEIPDALKKRSIADFRKLATVPFDEPFSQLVDLIYTDLQVFISMKFGDPELNSAYEEVIRGVVEAHGYRTLRIDEIQDSEQIPNKVLTEIAKSAIVLADLSGGRPNVYYEVGFAHGLQKELILTKNVASRLEFLLATYNVIIWKDKDDLRTKLKKRFDAIEKRRVRRRNQTRP
jgi:nucleoside 2-deoxyribosyltransferase